MLRKKVSLSYNTLLTITHFLVFINGEICIIDDEEDPNKLILTVKLTSIIDNL